MNMEVYIFLGYVEWSQLPLRVLSQIWVDFEWDLRYIPFSASVANSDLGIQIALKTGASRLLTWTGGFIYLTQSDIPEPIFKIFKIRKCSYLKVIKVNPFRDKDIN
jgi:hypothetical protein